MKHPYKTYSIEQLQAEETLLHEKLNKAKQEKRKNHILVYERKIEIVRSFMLDANDFQPGDVYTLKDDPHHHFKIDEINGVFAWGYKMNQTTGQQSIEIEGFLFDTLGEKI